MVLAIGATGNREGDNVLTVVVGAVVGLPRTTGVMLGEKLEEGVAVERVGDNDGEMLRALEG